MLSAELVVVTSFLQLLSHISSDGIAATSWSVDWNIGGIVFVELSAIEGAATASTWNLEGTGFASAYSLELMCHYAGEYQFKGLAGLQGEGTDYSARMHSDTERAGGGGGGSSSVTCAADLYGMGGGGGASFVRGACLCASCGLWKLSITTMFGHFECLLTNMLFFWCFSITPCVLS